MSKKCPHCGSYNTETAISNYVSRGALNAGRAVLALTAGLAATIISPNHGGPTASEVYKKTNPGEFKGYRCCECGKEFSA